MGIMLPLDPSAQDMRAMGEAALEYLIGFIQGLDDAPAEATDGAVELARELRSAPPEGVATSPSSSTRRSAPSRGPTSTPARDTSHTSPAAVSIRPRSGTSSPRA